MSTISQQFNARMQFLGITKQQLADATHKSLETVKKQLSDGHNNMTLATMEEYASALGGEICFITAETRSILDDSNVAGYQERIVALGEDNQRLKSQVDTFLAMIAEKDAAIAHNREIIEHKDSLIERKDDHIRALLDRILK